MPQERRNCFKGASSKKKARIKKRMQAMAFFALLLLVIAVLIFALLTREQKSPPSVISVASIAPSSSVAPPASSVPVVIGLFDEENAPPLFNAANLIPDEYYAQLTLIDVGVDESRGGQVQMQARAGEAFTAMRSAAKDDGVNFFPYSGHRSHERQTNNYNASVQRYLAQGLGQQEAVRRTQDYYAIPGTSEHEAGLAIDIDGIAESFENTAAFAWLQENAANYGFILRYPKSEEAYQLTNVKYEPWHYRYVGSNHAKVIWEENLTLEEYSEKIK